MASGFILPPPQVLEIHDANVADKWKKFRLAWDNYALATELDKKAEKGQVATLLTIIGEEARDVYSTFTRWASDAEKTKMDPVLTKFAEYCEPRKNVPFERYRFNRRAQDHGETYNQYKTALRKLAEGCEFGTITEEEILRDRLVFGIQDNKVRERLLRVQTDFGKDGRNLPSIGKHGCPNERSWKRRDNQRCKYCKQNITAPK